MPAVTFDQVRVAVESEDSPQPKVLLDAVSLRLDEARVGVIGANGSGKSTLLRLINGLVQPTSGTVTVDGDDTVGAVRKVRRNVGFVFTDPISQLSGGERQLMALAAVLAVQPRVLVLDEPSTLLDLRNRELLRRTLADPDQQIIMSTHDLDLALDMDRVLVIDQGRVAFDGAPADAVAAYRSWCLQGLDATGRDST